MRTGTLIFLMMIAVVPGLAQSEGGMTQLTEVPEVDWQPKWSPDGLTIAFNTRRSGNNGELWLMDVTDMDTVTVDRCTEWGFESTHSWHPDGTQIAFSNYGHDGGRWNIWTMNNDCTNVQRLTWGSQDEWWPAYDPDGLRIAYLAGPPDNLDLWIMDANGSNSFQCTSEPESLRAPSWSPDGQRIAYSNAFNTVHGTSDIYIIEVYDVYCGSSPVQITDDPANDGYLEWNHPRDKLAFVSDRSDNYDIWVINPDGTGLKQITTHPANDTSPGWSPSGDQLAFASARGGNEDIWVTDLSKAVAIDIKPGSCPNPLNIRSQGILPVAILGSYDLDVTTMDPASIRLAGVAPILSALEDVGSPFEPFTGKADCDLDCAEAGSDGWMDLTLKFDTQQIVAALGDIQNADCLVVELTGNLQGNHGATPIYGEDVVKIINKGRGSRASRTLLDRAGRHERMTKDQPQALELN